MGDFYKYYKKKKKILILTIFIGVNHGVANILNEYFYGGYILKIYILFRKK